MHRICRTDKDVDDLCAVLRQRRLPCTVIVRSGADRSLDQNALAHKWFAEVAKQTGEEAIEVKARAKLDIGCVILCRDDPEFLAFCKLALGHLDREKRIAAMAYVPVTSTFTTAQMTEFMDTFERMHRAQGFQLTHPEDA